MFTITNKLVLAPGVKRLDIHVPRIASVVKPGQYVVVVPFFGGKWIPLAVSDADKHKGHITLIFKEIGSATRQLGALSINDEFYSVSGPFGQPAQIKNWGTVVCACSGIGTAQMLPICRALRSAGNKVIVIIGEKNRREVMLEPQLRLSCHKLNLVTQDGLYERRRSISDMVVELIARERVGLVYAIGPVEMMETVASITEKKKIPMHVQLNLLILCGRGLCGSCRVRYNGQTILTCQHGPEFDAHRVDFANVRLRLQMVEQDRTPSDQSDGSDVLNKFFPGLLKK